MNEMLFSKVPAGNEAIANELRRIADLVEFGEYGDPESAVLVIGGVGDLMVVHGIGETCGSESVISSMRVAEAILIQSIMPDGVLKKDYSVEAE